MPGTGLKCLNANFICLCHSTGGEGALFFIQNLNSYFLTVYTNNTYELLQTFQQKHL